MAYSSSEVSDQHFDCVPIEDHVTRVSSEFNRSFAYSLPQQLMIDRSDIGSLRRDYLNRPPLKRQFTSSVWVSVGESLDKISNGDSTGNFDNGWVNRYKNKVVDRKMSYRYRDSHTQSSSLPRRYNSLPKSYSSHNATNSRDSSHSTRYRSISSSSTATSSTPATQSSRYGSLQTYGTSTQSSLNNDLKKTSSRRSTISTLSSRPVGVKSIPRKNSYPSSQSSSFRDSTLSYTARQLSSRTRRGSGSLSRDSSWEPGELPIRQRSSITLRETQPVWGPDEPPTRQYSSSSLRDSPFSLASKRTHSLPQDSGDTEIHVTSHRKVSPVESTGSSRSVSPQAMARYRHHSDGESQTTSLRCELSPGEATSTRPVSPSSVKYQGSESKEEPKSPKSPVVLYAGSIQRTESTSSVSESTSLSSSQTGSSGSQAVVCDNDNELESSAARDISLLSRQIASVYEGSLTRSDSNRGSRPLKKQKNVSGDDEKAIEEKKNLGKGVLTEQVTKNNKRTSEGKGLVADGKNTLKKEHKRSSSIECATAKDENKKPRRKLSGVFSRKKSSDSEGDEERIQRKSFFPHKSSKESDKEVTDRRNSSSSAHSGSPPVTPPKRKISGPSKFFSYSSDSKTTPEAPKKFSVPGKFFKGKDSSGGESSDLESDSSRSRSRMKRRVSLPGVLGRARSSSAERTGSKSPNPQPLIDPVLLSRRRSNFKKAQSFDVQSDTSKSSMLNKLKFWDHTKKEKLSDSRTSTSPEEGRSASNSPIPVHNNSVSSTVEKKLEDKTSRLRRNRDKTVKQASSLEKEPALAVKPEVTGLSRDQNLEFSQNEIHSSKGDDSSKVNGKEAKVQYVGQVNVPSPSEQHARKCAQYKVNSGKDSNSTVTPSKNLTGAQVSEVKTVEEKTAESNDSSTRDTVSKLRERRRRRREERERFFASMGSSSKDAGKPQDTQQNGHVQSEPSNTNDSVKNTVESKQDHTDGKITSGKKPQGDSVKRVELTPKLSAVGKRSTFDDVVQKEAKSKGGRPRYQTIASSVHADIIADLIREKGLKSTTSNEVKIPSVSELRERFLISKDDGKISPTRLKLKLGERPNSICGEVLSPTEMKKFDDITFSLARKVSSGDVKTKRFSDSSGDSLPRLDTQWTSIAKESKTIPPSSPEVRHSSKGDKKLENVPRPKEERNEEEVVTGESDTLKRKPGGKKKRKISIFRADRDKDKEPKTPEEEVESSQHGAVSAAIKAMFTRKISSSDKSKVPGRQRIKSMPDSSVNNKILDTSSDRERKTSAPEEIVSKSPEIVKSHPVKENKGLKAHMNVDNKAKISSETHPSQTERRESKDQVKTEISQEVKNVDNAKDIELHPVSGVEEKPKERKSLKKPSKNKKRTFKSTIKPFGGMMKTKSESNLMQRFDLIAVDIPIDGEPEPEKKKMDNDIRLISNETDETNKVEDLSSASQRERQPNVFEEGLKEFYNKKGEENKSATTYSTEITLEDLDIISGQTTQQLNSLTGDKMKIRPKRHHRTATNPIKNLQQRTDVRTDTEVERPRIEKKQVTSEHPVIKRKKKKYKDPDNLWRRHTLDLAASALAGLASTEDFTKVRLRKTAGPDEKDEFRGTKPVMLIHIKGRRHLQVRLVEPSLKSLNSGDCFALVTEKDLFSWIGKDCNPYEKAKVTEIVSKIKTKSELDCKARDIITIEDGDLDFGAALDKFVSILKGDTGCNKIKDAQSMPKDEDYEKGCVKGNMVYKIQWTDPPKLMPVESMCGHIPQVSILDTKEVFIFDFGSELYVWNGQQSLSGQRKSAFALAKQLYGEPFKAYGIYDPIFPYGKSENCNVEVDNKIVSQRPSWTLFARLHEKAETILFREKFLDWPDPTKIIRMKGHPSMLELAAQDKPPPVELKPCDPKMMLKSAPPLECPTFEGVNVGRGNGVPTVCVGDIYKEGNLVTTVELTVWHINEYRHFKLPPANHGHFHSGEGYVIRWAYFVLTDRIAKDRKSRCRSTVAGRVRCAYFFWQGNDCSVNEKGAAAIMAVELDEEKGPQVRVIQGKESPVFLNLFKGGMIIHNGSLPKNWYDPQTKNAIDETTATFTDNSTTRLYVIRNEEPGEAYLNQVKASSYSLRSRTSFVLVVRKEAHIYLWHGCKSSDDSRSTARAAAKKAQERKSIECNLAGLTEISLSEVEEGNEPDEFWKAIGGKKYYCSLAHDPSKHNYQPRLFELSSATGKFTATEILCPTRSEPKLCPFPFLQEDLYTAKQPGLFIVDGYYDVYVWEGWMPEDDDDVRTGSGRQRWDKDRRLAMETALDYAKEAGKRISHRVYVVYAGMEPMTFKALFPYWNDTPDVIRIQKQDGKQPNVRHSASEQLHQFTKDIYSLAELQKTPPPQGVDPAKLEAYLSDNDFQEIFKMDKEAFNKLPGWKQVNLKKAVRLF